ncbi:unnamed protein product [Camellia sinensis]
MGIMIKGGVWKNNEDEILKVAVMKYGKNQWARISSLLVRKSAKQCKARWTEWTREEDEKLLHLAKLMPTQWRTIAPIVGRTPSQCLERYEKLLDAEIDPNPESKPARPDPVDMDEDEKEMLSEAQARLANTRGKKAKRKAREKQLEEARRLASLQKRRELKAAGIQTRQKKRKRRGIDYNAEIPFEKKPPPGFFDVADEDQPVEQLKFPTTIEELEGEKRTDREARLRKQDIARNKIAQRQNAPSAILQANKLNDPEAVRKRSKLMLPAPQISDNELEEIAKMGYTSDLLAGSEELIEGNGATRALLANYAQTPRQGMTPLRTPQRTPAGKGDAIMMEAENLARLRESQTPLLGGENPELHPSDFSGVTPKKREIQTPNPMLTPSVTPGDGGMTPRLGMTPSRDSFGLTPKGTPIRDELHINEGVDMHESAKLELHRQADLRRNLSNLPQPKNEYQIVIQPVPEDNEEPEEHIEEDMSDRMAREEAEEEARQQLLLKKRSKVLQRELPRPPAASLQLIKNSLTRADEDKSSFVPPTLTEQANEMIRKELLSLLDHDNAKLSYAGAGAAREHANLTQIPHPHPCNVVSTRVFRPKVPSPCNTDAKYPLDEKADKDNKKGAKRAANRRSVSVPVIEDFEENELKESWSYVDAIIKRQEVGYFIKEEVQFLRLAMGHENESLDEFVEAHKTCLNDIMYFPTRNGYGLSSVAGNMEKLAALQNEFENVKKRMDDDTKKAQRLEQKIKLLTNGCQMDIVNDHMRAGKLWSQIEATFKQMDTAGTELECFQALQKQEQLAASHRINGLWEEVQKQELERTLQKRYGDLVAEKERIQSLVDAFRVQEEVAAKNRALELANAAANETAEPPTDEIPSQETDAAQVQANASPKQDMDADGVVENATPVVDVSSSDIMPSVSADDATQLKSVDENHSSDIPDQNSAAKLNINSDLTDGDEISMCGDTVNGTVGENLTSPEVAGGDLSAKDQQNTGEDGIEDSILTRPEDIVPETAEDGNADEDRQVSIEVKFCGFCAQLSETSVKEAVIVKNSLQEDLNSTKMVTRAVDLRSDTVTKPSQVMRAAMANAEVDDDVLGCDLTAFRLETELATITGKEVALFVPSGTMGNLISVLVHCEVRGSEVILGDNSHIHIYGNRGISTIGGVHPRTVKNNRDGTMDIDLIEAAIRDPRLEICYPTTRLICLETTHANCGGKCLPVEYIDKVGELAKKHGLKLHIDGARIFNASVALGIPVHRLVQAADSVSVCLSKGLGAPAGTVIVGSKDFITRGKTLRKTLGGGMRQVGVLCAAALVAVQENVGKLESDHNNAKIRLQAVTGVPDENGGK